MIVRKYYATREDGVKLYKTYSDANHFIKQVQTGIVYSEAIDVENAPYSYEETEETIPVEKTEEKTETE